MSNSKNTDSTPPTSKQFRNTSMTEFLHQQTIVQTLTPQATLYSATHNVSLDEAFTQLAPEYDRWKNVRLEGYDSRVGDVITGQSITIVCNSLLKNGLYNDTIGIHFDTVNRNEFDANNSCVVTYNQRETWVMSHSGDKTSQYGLEHVIELDWTHFRKGYVISAPWLSNCPRPIATLAETNPVLEIRTETDGVLKRFVIPQDYNEGNDKTACVNCEIVYNSGLWTVTIRRDFIMGFANDTGSLIRDIVALHDNKT